MAVYLIITEESRRVKIVFTAGPSRLRLAKMQTDNHERLSILRWLDGDEAAEAALQSRYSALRLRGDWHRFCPTMLGDLGFADIVETAPEPEPLDRIIHLLGGEAAVAAACGCGAPAISNWKKRGLPKSRWVDLVALAQRLGKMLTLEQVAMAAKGAPEKAAA